MKALLYKELKLAMHPICYIFIALFPLMILIPSYPLFVGFIYVLVCYPVLFLGANKGQQSNDLLYSVLLPIRKKDIVLARLMTVILMQLAYIALASCLYPLALVINHIVKEAEPELTSVGLGLNGYVSLLAIAITGYAIADMIYFPIYYKKGKSIVLSTLLMILGNSIFLVMLTVVIPYIPGCEGYTKLLCESGVGIQFAFLGAAIIISAALHFAAYKISAKRLELVDF